MAWVYPRAKKWDIGITHQRVPRRARGHHRAVLLGQRLRVGRSSASSAASSSSSASTSSNTVRIDDPIGAVAVHGIAGIWGTWAVGLFATGQFGDPAVEGLFWGGGTAQLWAQIWGNAVIGITAFVVALAVMYGCKKANILRVSEEGEREGIDIHEHGAPAYHPEAAYTGTGVGS